MYRVKITHCAPIIENIYGSQYPYYLRDVHDLWIEVKTMKEQTLIDFIEEFQEKTFLYVQKLQKAIEERSHD